MTNRERAMSMAAELYQYVMIACGDEIAEQCGPLILKHLESIYLRAMKDDHRLSAAQAMRTQLLELFQGIVPDSVKQFDEAGK